MTVAEISHPRLRRDVERKDLTREPRGERDHAGAPCAVYSLMKIELPPSARLNTPPTPPPPPICVDVCMTIDCVIQESSPDSEKIASPGSSVSSSTGIVVPTIRSCTACPPNDTASGGVYPCAVGWWRYLRDSSGRRKRECLSHLIALARLIRRLVPSVTRLRVVCLVANRPKGLECEEILGTAGRQPSCG